MILIPATKICIGRYYFIRIGRYMELAELIKINIAGDEYRMRKLGAKRTLPRLRTREELYCRSICHQDYVRLKLKKND